MNESNTFSTAFNCMDGRCQNAVNEYVRNTYGVAWVDAINEPGIDGILSGKKPVLPVDSATAIACIKAKAEISAKGHGSTHAVIVGHSRCAGNNVSDEEHIEEIRKATELVESWGLFETVESLMVTQKGGEWRVYSPDAISLELKAA